MTAHGDGEQLSLGARDRVPLKRAVAGPTRWSWNASSVTTPKLPRHEDARTARSPPLGWRAHESRPSAVTASAESRLAPVIPCLRSSHPEPLPSVRPAIPVCVTRPPVTARPCCSGGARPAAPLRGPLARGAARGRDGWLRSGHLCGSGPLRSRRLTGGSCGRWPSRRPGCLGAADGRRRRGYAAGFFAFGALGWYATSSALPEQSGSALLAYAKENAVHVFGPQIAGFLLAVLGCQVLAVALWRSRAVPRWLPVTVPVTFLLAMLAGTGIAFDVANAVFMATFVAVAWFLWRSGPAVR